MAIKNGNIEVRVVLRVEVDPIAWARTMMDEDPAEILQRDVRADVKRRVRNLVADMPLRDSDYEEGTSVPVGWVE